MKTLILAALIAFSTTPAYGDLYDYWMSGNDLLSSCTATEKTYLTSSDKMSEYGQCVGYIKGWLDGIGWYGASVPTCVPKGVTVGQLVEMTVKYLRENPAIRHEIVTRHLSDAFKEFRCPDYIEE
jgi:hypothetical protein